MAEWPVVVEVVAGPDAAGLGAAPGDPIAGGIVEAAATEPPREVRSATTNDAGVAELSLPSAGTFMVTLTHNVEGGAFLADARVDVVEAGQRIVLEARAFTQ